MSPPTPAEPALLPCATCEGRDAVGCPECDGAGHIELTECPRRLIPDDVAEAVRLARMVKTAGLPVAGGTLDQTASFNAAMVAYEADLSMWEAEQAKRAKADANG